MKFYNFITSDLVNSISNKIHYEKLSINIQIDFYISALEFLENKELQLEYVKIIRRIKEEENKINLTKGIIKFGLTLVNHNIISPDIINKIILISSTNKKYEINNKDIYYENDTDITGYVDNLDENINEVIITNNFGGEMKAKNIINVQGSGPTNKMIKDNIEKLFLIPFFKLFEIFYSTINNEGKKNEQNYNELKEENFGKNFEDLKILKTFEKQIQIINELLFLSRPDILGNLEKTFIEKYIKNELDKNQMNYFEVLLKDYYKQAIEIQKEEKINCLDSEPDSIAKKVSFPLKFKENPEIKNYLCARVPILTIKILLMEILMKLM